MKDLVYTVSSRLPEMTWQGRRLVFHSQALLCSIHLHCLRLQMELDCDIERLKQEKEERDNAIRTLTKEKHLIASMKSLFS